MGLWDGIVRRGTTGADRKEDEISDPFVGVLTMEIVSIQTRKIWMTSHIGVFSVMNGTNVLNMRVGMNLDTDECLTFAGGITINDKINIRPATRPEFDKWRDGYSNYGIHPLEGLDDDKIRDSILRCFVNEELITRMKNGTLG